MIHKQPLVYIIILIYNNKEEVECCVKSLEQITYTNYRILLIDNDSPDGGGIGFSGRFPKHEFIANQENLGFARGCNVGIRFALERGADYVLLLNGDMIVEPNFLEPMIELMQYNQQAGLASGKIFHLDNGKELWYAGGKIQLWRGQLLVDHYKKTDTIGDGPPIPTGFCTGAMMLIPKKVLLEVGLLPEEYFFGVEEWDYSLNVLRHGYKLYFVPKAVAHHVIARSFKDRAIMFHYGYYRNKKIFQKKYLPKPLYWIWEFIFLLYIYLVLPYRTNLIHKGNIPPKSLVFAAKRAFKDQQGSKPVQWNEILLFEKELIELEMRQK